MCSHFLYRPRTSHNQILNKSGKWEQAYVTEKQEREATGLLVFFGWQKTVRGAGWLQLTKTAFCFKRGERAEATCIFCPTGNNFADSISLQHLSQTHDLPGWLSVPSSLPASSSFPPNSWVFFTFYQAAIVSPGCIIRMICHCCFVYLRSAHICHGVWTWEKTAMSFWRGGFMEALSAVT